MWEIMGLIPITSLKERVGESGENGNKINKTNVKNNVGKRSVSFEVNNGGNQSKRVYADIVRGRTSSNKEEVR